MSIGTRSKGTRLWYATDATTWTALVAGGSPSSPWTEVTCPVRISNPKRFEASEFDTSCLSDSTEQPVQEIKPGGFSFNAKQNSGTDAIKTLADATTKKAWAVVYTDGRAFYISSGVLIPDSEGDAENSITHEVMHTYRVRGLVVGAWEPPSGG